MRQQVSLSPSNNLASHRLALHHHYCLSMFRLRNESTPHNASLAVWLMVSTRTVTAYSSAGLVFLLLSTIPYLFTWLLCLWKLTSCLLPSNMALNLTRCTRWTAASGCRLALCYALLLAELYTAHQYTAYADQAINTSAKTGSSQCSKRSPKISFSIIPSKQLNASQKSPVVIVVKTGSPLHAATSVCADFLSQFIFLSSFWLKVSCITSRSKPLVPRSDAASRAG